MTLFSAWHFSRRERESYADSALEPSLPYISIIVPFRNEAQTIVTCLRYLKNQSYPIEKCEILCVDDHSEDNSYEIARDISRKSPNIRVFTLSAHRGAGQGKKAALQLGISAAKGEIILQTDADCIVPPNWALRIVRSFTPEVAMVAGPVRLSYSNTILQQLQALEIMGLAILGGGAMIGGKPHMCNGANLAFRRSVFEEIGGYENIDHVASGDDELLLQKVAKNTSFLIKFCADKQAIVTTAAVETWKSLRKQRIRWVSKVRHYLDHKVQFLQLTSYLAFWGVGLYFLMSIWNPLYWGYFFTLILVKFSADLILMHVAGAFFSEKRLLWLLPLLECLYVPYVLWLGIAGNFVRSYTWKNRTVS
ncbi:MAG: glycosyltransferase [Bacteroidota bacterium]